MTPRERWLAAVWPFVRSNVSLPPGRVVDIGCGPHGGFVPMLREDGYDAIGIDPKAPEEEHFQRVEFERAALPEGSTPSSLRRRSTTSTIRPRWSTASSTRCRPGAWSS
jgi:hypothetical protein